MHDEVVMLASANEGGVEGADKDVCDWSPSMVCKAVIVIRTTKGMA